MLRAIEAGHQAALMAPTETLAEQHFRTLETLLAAEPAPATLLTSATPPARRRELLDSLAAGQPQLVVGTHALIEEAVEFSSLAVAVVDEQHRFGVRQRAALDAKGPGQAAAARPPHDGHADPADALADRLRRPRHDGAARAARRVASRSAPGSSTRSTGPAAYEFIRERLREGRQAYVVCPLVSDSEAIEAKAAEAEAKRLAATELRDFRVALLHGQMSSEQKARAMDAFSSGEADVLVATTVIEVGIDVPNATVMLVEGAERFGLSQLHQLRGRVGRGSHESFCILFGDPESDAAKARLEAIAGEGDGFALAEVDLSIRGEGEILGTRQHGLPRFRAASLPEDTALAARGPQAGAGAAGPLRLARGARGRPADGRGAAALRRRAGRADRRVASVRGGDPDHRRGAARPAALRAEGRASARRRAGCARRSSRCSAASTGARVLDLFCGSGALGIEALSRGARRGDLRGRRRLQPSRRNLEELGVCTGQRVRRRASSPTSVRFLAPRGAGGSYELVLCDPPYRLAADLVSGLDHLLPDSLQRWGQGGGRDLTRRSAVTRPCI